MSALRLARAFTGRSRVLKFAGGYHGHADPFLASAGSGLATLGIPASPGVPASVVADTVVVDYNDADAATAAVEQVRRRARGDLRRAGRREHRLRSARPRLPRDAPLALRCLRRAARVRRGDHRLPGCARRRPGALRRPARPDRARQDRRRWPPARRVRRKHRDHVAARAGRRRLPGRDAVRKPARDRRRDLGSPAPARPGRLRRPRAAARPPRGWSRRLRPGSARRRDADVLRSAGPSP